jgi:hypothetical protein
MLTGKTKHGANSLDPKALFHAINGHAWHSDFFFALTAPGQKNGIRRRGLSFGDQLILISLMQRGEEQRSLCFWHLFFVLIL